MALLLLLSTTFDDATGGGATRWAPGADGIRAARGIWAPMWRRAAVRYRRAVAVPGVMAPYAGTRGSHRDRGCYRRWAGSALLLKQGCAAGLLLWIHDPLTRQSRGKSWIMEPARQLTETNRLVLVTVYSVLVPYMCLDWFLIFGSSWNHLLSPICTSTLVSKWVNWRNSLCYTNVLFLNMPSFTFLCWFYFTYELFLNSYESDER
jgi:hypothetical protein